MGIRGLALGCCKCLGASSSASSVSQSSLIDSFVSGGCPACSSTGTLGPASVRYRVGSNYTSSWTSIRGVDASCHARCFAGPWTVEIFSTSGSCTWRSAEQYNSIFSIGTVCSVVNNCSGTSLPIAIATMISTNGVGITVGIRGFTELVAANNCLQSATGPTFQHYMVPIP